MGRYPTTEHGLAALRKEPDDVKNWDGPYLSKDVPLDPWRVAYLYKVPGKEGPFALYTFGLDQAQGGVDEDQDVGAF